MSLLDGMNFYRNPDTDQFVGLHLGFGKGSVLVLGHLNGDVHEAVCESVNETGAFLVGIHGYGILQLGESSVRYGTRQYEPTALRPDLQSKIELQLACPIR